LRRGGGQCRPIRLRAGVEVETRSVKRSFDDVGVPSLDRREKSRPAIAVRPATSSEAVSTTRTHGGDIAVADGGKERGNRVRSRSDDDVARPSGHRGRERGRERLEREKKGGEKREE
jgi:hypothetical protein